MFQHSIFTHQSRQFHCIIPALIGALGTIGAGAIGAASQYRQNKQNLASARDMARYQWENFGSPQAQKSAYEAAGINPFAQGQISAQSPQMQVPDQQAPGLVFGQALQSFIVPFANLLAVNSQIKNLQAQTAQIETSTQGILLDNDLKRFDLGELKVKQLKLLEKQIEQTQASTNLSRAQIKSISYGILKTQSETQGINLQNRFQEMENEWKRIQGEKGMPSTLAEWQELQNRRLQQQINIDLPEEDLRKTKEAMFKNFHDLFNFLNDDKTLGQSFAGIPLVEPGQKAIFRGILSLLLYKLMTGF